jgi:hypothetical protein
MTRNIRKLRKISPPSQCFKSFFFAVINCEAKKARVFVYEKHYWPILMERLAEATRVLFFADHFQPSLKFVYKTWRIPVGMGYYYPTIKH